MAKMESKEDVKNSLRQSTIDLGEVFDLVEKGKWEDAENLCDDVKDKMWYVAKWLEEKRIEEE